MATAKEVFTALPHVNEVWITEDGNHHLHAANGGQHCERGVVDIDELDEPTELAKAAQFELDKLAEAEKLEAEKLEAEKLEAEKKSITEQADEVVETKISKKGK